MVAARLKWARRARTIARLLAWATILVPLVIVVSPWLADTSTYGLHDWDFEAGNRYLVKTSLLTYGQAPFWNPYACGGFPAWGFIEGGTTLVSPWLLPYLVLSIPLALRVEVIGSALLGAVGAFKVAGQFTRSSAGRALVVALWAVDGRWALQAAAGHTWHLLYAWMPWCFYFFERTSRTHARFRATLGLAVSLALLVYGGGIYPLPHVVLALGLYAGFLAISERSMRPLMRLVVPGALGAALSAPKLLPMLHELTRAPRIIASPETTRPDWLWLALTAREQTLRARFASGGYAWHEYGMYVGVVGVAVLLLGVVLVRGRRETALKAVGLLFAILGFGAFHDAAPWSLLHEYAPFFRSQHVPSRFFYPSLLLLGLVAASGVGRLVRGRSRLDAVLGALVLLLAIDIAIVARKPMTESMRLRAPEISTSATFHHDEVSPYRYWPANFAMPSYLSMLGNSGVIQCYGIPPIDRVGARSVTDPRFHGEATVLPPNVPFAETAGDAADVLEWSPNRVLLGLHTPPAASTVVYNMNFDDGWTSDEGPVSDVDGKVAVRLGRARDRVTFTYRPRLLQPGLLVAALGVILATAFGWRERRRELPRGRIGGTPP